MKSYIDTKYEANKLKEKLQRKAAWALPRSVAMWAYIRVAAHATTGKWSSQVVPELSMMDALERWDNENAPMPIHPSLITAHNYIKYAKALEQKQGYERVIEWSRLPKTIKHNGYTYTLKYRDIDDNVTLSYTDSETPKLDSKTVLMHYEESTLRDCITKAWRKIAEEGIKVK